MLGTTPEQRNVSYIYVIILSFLFMYCFCCRLLRSTLEVIESSGSSRRPVSVKHGAAADGSILGTNLFSVFSLATYRISNVWYCHKGAM